jgi:hypothetical protein
MERNWETEREGSLTDFIIAPDIITTIKLRRARWSENFACMEEIRKPQETHKRVRGIILNINIKSGHVAWLSSNNVHWKVQQPLYTLRHTLSDTRPSTLKYVSSSLSMNDNTVYTCLDL